ncbi:MAG: hypothetical protein K2Z81_28020, partial [Cyanobacteria bacterium]|nr:hypothetical protein [Cyanobacteriota bacterium]
ANPGSPGGSIGSKPYTNILPDCGRKNNQVVLSPDLVITLGGYIANPRRRFPTWVSVLLVDCFSCQSTQVW